MRLSSAVVSRARRPLGWRTLVAAWVLVAAVPVAGFPIVPAAAAVSAPEEVESAPTRPEGSSAPAGPALPEGDFSDPPSEATVTPIPVSPRVVTVPPAPFIPTRAPEGFVAGRSVEDRSSRTDDSKTFSNEDGTKTTQISTDSVHYWDGSGWKDIDNTVVADSTRPGTLRNKANRFVARFSQTGVSVEAPEGSVSMAPLGAEMPAPTVDPDGQAVTYPEVWPGVDVRYRVVSNGVKEEVVLRRRPEATSFRFSVAGAGVIARADGGLDLSGPLAGKWWVLPPVVLDRDGDAVAEAAPRLRVERGGDGVVLEVAPGWIEGLTPADYPVVIDPTVQTVGGSASRAYPNVGTTCDPCSIRVGGEPSSGPVWRSVVAFDYSNGGTWALDGATIMDATVKVWDLTAGTSTSTWMDLYHATGWDFGSTGVQLGHLDGQDDPPIAPDVSYTFSTETMRSFYADLIDQHIGGAALRFVGREDSGFYKQFNAFTLSLTWNRAPTISSYNSPADNAVLYDSNSVTMSASASDVNCDPNCDPIFYQFDVSTSSTFSSLIPTCGSVTTGSCTVSLPWNGAAPNARYYWRVRVNDGHLETTGGTWSFVLNGPPTPSNPAAPGNAAPVGTLTPTLVGTLDSYPADPLDPVEYWFRVSNTDNPEVGIVADSGWLTPTPPGTAPKWKIPASAQLRDGATYSWMIYTKDGHYQVASGAWKFKTNLRLGDQSVNPWDTAGPVQVNLATGNVVVKTGSATLQTVGGPLGVSFTYNSLTPAWLAGSALPAGWSMSVDPQASLAYDRLVVVGSSVVLVEPSGVVHEYRQGNTATAAWIPMDDDGAVVTQSASQFLVHGRDGLTYRFDSTGKLLSATRGDDRDDGTSDTGQVFDQRSDPSYRYDGSGRLSEIADRLSGRAVKLFYAGDPQGCDTSGGAYVTPVAGRLCRVQYFDAGGVFIFETHLKYKSSGDLARIVNPGSEITDFYYVAGTDVGAVWTGRRLSEITSPLANDAFTATPVPQRTDGTGARTLIDYATDAVGRVTSVRLPFPLATDPVRPQHSYTFVYDTVGDPYANLYAIRADVVVAGQASPLGYTRRVTLNSLGQVVGDLGPDGKGSSFTWWPDGRMRWRDDATGYRTSTLYDSQKRPTNTFGPAQNTTVCWTDDIPTGSCAMARTRTAYDGAVTFTDDGGPTTNISTGSTPIRGLAAAYWKNQTLNMAPWSRETGTGTAGGNMTANWGSGSPATLGATTEGWSATYTGEIFIPSVAGTNVYGFNLNLDTADGARLYIDNQLVIDRWTGAAAGMDPAYTAWTAPKVGWFPIRIEYKDISGAAKLELYWNGPGLASEVVPGTRLTPRYDLPTASRDADGKVTVTEYASPERGLATATVADPAGLALRTTTDYEPPGTAGKYGRVDKTRLPRWAGTGVYTQHDYYPAGGTIGSADPCVSGSAAVTQAPGMPWRTTDPDPGPSAADPGGTQQARVTEAVYDRLGRVIATYASRVATSPPSCVHYDDRGRVVWGRDHNLAETNISYNGLITTITYPDPTTADDTTPCVDAGVGEDGLCTTKTEVDLLGRPFRYTDEHGTVTTHTYDPAGRVIRTDRTFPGQTAAQLSGVAYDDNTGRIASMTDYSGGIGAPRATTFTYDDAGRLLTTSKPNGTATTQSYDSVDQALAEIKHTLTLNGTTTTQRRYLYVNSLAGRITQEQELYALGTTAYTYDAAGRLTKAVNGATRNYAYDPNSNRCSLSTTCDGSYAFDEADRLVSTPDTLAYNYDAYGNVTSISGTASSFADGFETGNLSAWTVTTGGDGTAAAQTTTVKTGTYAAKFSSTANASSKAYARRTLPAPQTQVIATGNFRVSAEGASGNAVPLLRLFDNAGNRIVSLHRQNQAGDLLKVQHSGGFYNSGLLPLNQWANLELRVVVAGAGAGKVEVRLNGSVVYTTTTASIPASVSTVQLGQDVASLAGTVFADDVTIAHGAKTTTFGYDGNHHATTINDGSTLVEESLAPSGRVIRRKVTNIAVTPNVVTEDILLGYDGPGDSPAYEQPNGVGWASPVLLSDNWTGTDNTAWASRWATSGNTSPSGTRDVDIAQNQGRLYVGVNANTGAQAQPDPLTSSAVSDSEVNLSYRFGDRNAGSWFRVALRGDTGWPMNSGYRLEIPSDNTTVKVQRVVAGIATTPTGWTFTYPLNTTTQRVRYRVQGNTIKVKIWAAGTTEPTAWTKDLTDTDPTAITGTGRLKLVHSAGLITAARSVYVDDLIYTDLTKTRRTYVNGPGGLLATDTNGEATYPLGNRQGTIAGTTDTTGALTTQAVPDEYGKGTTPTSRLGWLGQHQRFTTDPASGIIRMGVRLYDPNLGRFLSVDPIKGGSANNYDYVGGDPINSLDLPGTNKCEFGLNPFRWGGNAQDCASDVTRGGVDLVQRRWNKDTTSGGYCFVLACVSVYTYRDAKGNRRVKVGIQPALTVPGPFASSSSGTPGQYPTGSWSGGYGLCGGRSSRAQGWNFTIGKGHCSGVFSGP